MKKLLVVLLAFTSVGYAVQGDANCTKEAQNIASRVKGRKNQSITINYSSDMAAKARACKNDLGSQSIIVHLNEVNGSNKFKLSK